MHSRKFMLAVIIAISDTFLTVNFSDDGPTIKPPHIAPVKHQDTLQNLCS